MLRVPPTVSSYSPHLSSSCSLLSRVLFFPSVSLTRFIFSSNYSTHTHTHRVYASDAAAVLLFHQSGSLWHREEQEEVEVYVFMYLCVKQGYCVHMYVYLCVHVYQCACAMLHNLYYVGP